jgi:uncharacterized metal-binding protein YceD (DUF177 family)
MTPPEFSRSLRVDRVPRGGSFEKLAADPAECAAMAARLGVVALHALTAGLKATPWRGGGLKVEGELMADLEQVSVVSLEAFRSEVRFNVLRYFMPADRLTGEDGEAEIDAIVGGEVDLGEVVAETLALELDPYPRRPGEEFSPAQPEVSSEVSEKPSPFAALQKLKGGPT